jgi:hypothetical protein
MPPTIHEQISSRLLYVASRLAHPKRLSVRERDHLARILLTCAAQVEALAPPEGSERSDLTPPPVAPILPPTPEAGEPPPVAAEEEEGA